MTDDPKSVAKLKAYYKASIVWTDEYSVSMAAAAEESDRAAVVIIGSILEDALKQEIQRKMKRFEDENAFNRLFNFDGPLGTFGSKIDMACALGVIDDEARGLFHLVREMRNACAHSQRQISFATPELWNVCQRLTSGPRSFARVADKRFNPDDISHRRGLFEMQTTFLLLVILDGSYEKAMVGMRRFLVREKQRASPDTPLSPRTPKGRPDRKEQGSPSPPKPSRGSRPGRRGKVRQPPPESSPGG